MAYAQNPAEGQSCANVNAELVTNPYGIGALWDGSDSITKFVLLFIKGAPNNQHG